jgi:DNA-binding transcriptional ArsR family regulator
MFELDKELRVLILQNLPEDGMSISALSRLLNEKGIKLHRLELSGYLKALSDVGVLRERDIKPSKVFSPSQLKKKDVYTCLGDLVKKEEDDEDKQASIALFILGKLFKRAIFDKELRMCGLRGTPASKRATDKERADAAAVMVKAGIKVGASDAAFVSTGNYPQASNKVIPDLLIDLAGLRAFVAETKQKTLEEG